MHHQKYKKKGFDIAIAGHITLENHAKILLYDWLSLREVLWSQCQTKHLLNKTEHANRVHSSKRDHKALWNIRINLNILQMIDGYFWKFS